MDKSCPKGGEHEPRYRDANNSVCKKCGTVIPNAHVYFYFED